MTAEGAALGSTRIRFDNAGLLIVEHYEHGTLLRYEPVDVAGRRANAWVDPASLRALVVDLAAELVRRDPGRHLVELARHDLERVWGAT